MPLLSQHYYRRVMRNEQPGMAASLFRGIASLAEPVYAFAANVRNRLYDARWLRAHRVPRPVICIGNITTGGTGKTPVVRWLANQLRQAGHHPAILMRGYKSTRELGSDEQKLLKLLLESPAPPANARIPVIANPNRLKGARMALAVDPAVDVFILDDGFQHRRLAREFDLVLIDAMNPFGYQRQLPRGLLRESLFGLRRANAFLVTKAEGATPDRLAEIEQTIRRFNPWAPLYRSRQVHSGVLTPAGERLPIDLVNRRFFIFAAIGHPESFERQLCSSGGSCVGRKWFDDHHRYTAGDLAELDRQAQACRADVMLTTEKDWVKLGTLEAAASTHLPIWRVQLEIEFHGNDDQLLLKQIQSVIASPTNSTAPRQHFVSPAPAERGGDANDA